MYHVLVADDDADIRSGILQIIDRSFGGRVRVFQCVNGEQAVELTCGERIDVVVADIQMPVCDGIEMIHRLRALDFGGEIMVVSGFGDYNYVRQAMKLGAQDYILKPIDTAEFTVLLENCLRRAAGKGNQSPAEGVGLEHILLQQQYRLKQLLAGEELPGELPRWVLTAALDRSVRGRPLSADAKAALFLRIGSLAAELLPAGTQLLQGETGAQWGVALLGEKEPLLALRGPLADRLQEEGIRAGIAPAPVRLSGAAKAWKGAVAALESHFYDISPVIEPHCDLPFTTELAELAQAACSCDAPLLTQGLYRLFGLFCYRKVPPDQARQLLVGLCYRIMGENSGFVGIIGRYKFTDWDFIQAVQDAPCASVLRERTVAILGLYVEELRQKREKAAAVPGGEDFAVQKALHMIEEGYHTDISLTSISERLGLHPNYLSTLFRQKTGRTYSQYLRTFRIEKAKALMAGTTLKLYTVGGQVGYKDSAHFYRAFKEETGLSPAQYKKKHGQGRFP